jgi:hypothetical protein
MSGALVQLVAQGVQDVYISNRDSESSFFKMKYTRHTSFSQAPKLLKTFNATQGEVVSIKIPSMGDLINKIWLENDSGIFSNVEDCTFTLYIGGQKIDSFDTTFLTDIWTIYMADTYTKAQMINNKTSTSNDTFFPLHFFFCDNGMFLPLICLQYHEVEIRIDFPRNVSNIRVYGNFVYLDTRERRTMAEKSMEFLIKQVQKQTYTIGDGTNNIPLDVINHPVTSLYWGYKANDNIVANDKFCFTTADIHLNGTPLFENMSNTYFHSIQGYYSSPNALINFDTDTYTPRYTRFYTYNFSLDASSYKPCGTCNFSRLDNAKLILKGVDRRSTQADELSVYAVNYNVLKIERGMGGVLFSN